MRYTRSVTLEGVAWEEALEEGGWEGWGGCIDKQSSDRRVMV